MVDVEKQGRFWYGERYRPSLYGLKVSFSNWITIFSLFLTGRIWREDWSIPCIFWMYSFKCEIYSQKKVMLIRHGHDTCIIT